jgi:hypothetical protein
MQRTGATGLVNLAAKRLRQRPSRLRLKFVAGQKAPCILSGAGVLLLSGAVQPFSAIFGVRFVPP